MHHAIIGPNRYLVIIFAALLLEFSALPTQTALSAQSMPQIDLTLYGSDANTYRTFAHVSDPSAAGGFKMTTADEGWSSLNAPPIWPTLDPFAYYAIHVPVAGEYRLWLRMRGQGNSKWNESVWVQFTDATQNGQPAYRIGTEDGLLVNLEDCFGCGIQEWGWQDNAWWLDQSSLVTLPSGPQSFVVFLREDGVEIDQIVLSPARFKHTPPGGLKDDATILLRTEVLLNATDVTEFGKVSIVEDEGSAADKVSSNDAGWASPDQPPANPLDGGYADFAFNVPQAGEYHLWIRMQAKGDTKWNDSVWVQFDQAWVDGVPSYRIHSQDGLLVNLENCFGCGVQSWGWQDNSWWLNQSGIVTLPEGTNRIRVLVREDGVEFDQIVLSPARFLAASPGELKNDRTFVTHTWH